MTNLKRYFRYHWEDVVWRLCLGFLGIFATMFIIWVVLCITFLVDPGNPYNWFDSLTGQSPGFFWLPFSRGFFVRDMGRRLFYDPVIGWAHWRDGRSRFSNRVVGPAAFLSRNPKNINQRSAGLAIPITRNPDFGLQFLKNLFLSNFKKRLFYWFFCCREVFLIYKKIIVFFLLFFWNSLFIID